MRISAPAVKCRHVGATGFSLVELMVVLVLVGLTAGVAVLAWPSGDDGVTGEADRFAGQIERAVDLSILHGDLLGLQVTPEGYSFSRYRRGLWTKLSGDALPGGTWSEETQVTLLMAGTRRTVEEGPVGAAKPTAPAIRFDPIGLVTPFGVELLSGTQDITVISDAAGQVTITATGAASR